MPLLCCLATGCVADAPPEIALNAATAVPAPMGLVFWIDGLDVEHYQRLLAAGRLPNIRKYLVDRGVSVRNAVAGYPTITYANNASFATGLLPGHHGLVDNKWFDRHSMVFKDYGFISSYQQADEDFRAETIFEALDDELTASILTPVRRGVTRNIDNWMSAGVAWHFNLQETINVLTTARFELIAGVANRTGRWPKFILAYFVTPDTVAHRDGPSDPDYTEMLVHIDRQIGHTCMALEKAGLLDKTVLSLISDHGFVDTPSHFDVAEYFRKELGIATVSGPFGRDKPFEDRVKHFAEARAVVVVGGNRHCAIHLRSGEHWWERPTPEEIDKFVVNHTSHGLRFSLRALWRPNVANPISDRNLVPLDLPGALARQEAAELAVVRLGDDSVRVLSADGAGVIERAVRDGVKLYRYRVDSAVDPLGYAGVPAAKALMDRQFHPAEAWFRASLGTPHPDAVVQLIELNDSPRAGDIMLFARDGWDFGGKDKGGHGGLLAHEIVVPWVFAGPGLPAGATIDGARTVDLTPTMLHLMGRPDAVPPGLDGMSIAERLRSAAASGPSPTTAHREFRE